MATETIIIVAVILVIGLAWIGQPFIRRERGKRSSDLAVKQRERLLVYYEQALASVRDLDEDYSTGKIRPDDYNRERELWTARGVQVLQALEDLDGESIVEKPLQTGESTPDIDDAIEAMVAERLRAAKAR